MVFFSESEVPCKHSKLFGLDDDFRRLLAFCNLVWSDKWTSRKELYALNATVMLYGSPGTGKTSLLRNVAAQMHPQNVQYFSYSLERLLHRDLGRSSEDLRSLFDFIRSTSAKEQKMLVHFDDVDSVLSSRFIENESSGVKRFVNTFIKELDTTFLSAQQCAPVIAVTTNIYPMIDSAVKRRFSLKLSIENSVGAEEFRVWLAPLIKDLDVQGEICYESLYNKMLKRNLTPYDVYLVMQRMLLDSLSGLSVNAEAIGHEFDLVESSGASCAPFIETSRRER